MNTTDEQAIRATVAEWIAASRRGDAQAVLNLVTDDVLFLQPGKEPMDRTAFEAAQRTQASQKLLIDVESDIREVQVEGNMAFLWSKLAVTVKPAGGSAVKREGHTLTIFRKRDGRWLLARDANLLVQR